MGRYDLSMTGSAVRPTNPKSIAKTTSSENFIQHYGVPGQKWGVITKEYQPVAIDHRRMRKPETYSIRKPSSPQIQAKKRPTVQEIQEQSEKAKKRLALIGVSAATLLAAYAGYRYLKVTKAKAYSGILDKFLSQTPGANLRTEEGQKLLRRGIRFAEENSKTLDAAKATNLHFQKTGHVTLSEKNALRMYNARKQIHEAAKIDLSKKPGTRFIDRRRMNRLLKTKVGYRFV